MNGRRDGTDEPNQPEQAARDLAENGREEHGWRVVDGERRLVVVRIGFTVTAQRYEDFACFRQRMVQFARRLEALQYPVTRLTFNRREAQGKLPWCELDCETPEAALPIE